MRKYIATIALFIVAYITHIHWFNLYALISAEDMTFFYDTFARNLLHYNTWLSVSGFGEPNIQGYKIIFYLIQSVVVAVGFTYTNAIQVTHFIPIAILGFLSPYYLSRYLSKDKMVSFVLASVYGTTTTFIIRQSFGHLSIALIVALSPLILLLFFRALQFNTLREWIFFIILYSVGIVYELRIMYIVTLILSLYALFEYKRIKHQYKEYAFALISVLLLNLYWILPLVFGHINSNIAKVAERPLFGNSHFSMLRAMSLMHSSWNGHTPIAFTDNPISFYFLLPITLLIFTIFFLKRTYNKKIFFFILLLLFGLLLSKQVSEPFVNLFPILREYVPGFILFRSSSKFYFVVMLSILGLFASTLPNVKYGVRVFILALLFITSVFNVLPVVRGEIGRTFGTYTIPNDYIMYHDVLHSANLYFRTLSVPRASRWQYASYIHPSISGIDVYQQIFADNNGSVEEKILSPFKKHYSKYMLSILNIRFVSVPVIESAENKNNFFWYGGKQNPNIRQWYIDQLDKLDYLEKIDIGTKELVVYENKDYKPYIRGIDNLLAFNSTKNLEDKYTFVNGTLHKDFDFLVKNEKKKIPSEEIMQIFEDAESENVKNDKVVDTKSAGYKDILYRNANKRDLIIKTTDDKSKIVAVKKERLIVNGEKLVDKDDTQVIFTLNDDYYNYYIKDGGIVIPFVNNARLNSEVPNEIYKGKV